MLVRGRLCFASSLIFAAVVVASCSHSTGQDDDDASGGTDPGGSSATGGGSVAVGGSTSTNSGGGQSSGTGGASSASGAATGTGGAAAGGGTGDSGQGGAAGSSGGAVESGATSGGGGNGGSTSGAGGASSGSGGATSTPTTGGSGGGNAGGSGPTPGAGLSLDVGGATLKIEMCADNVVRVAYAKSAAFFTRASLTTAAKQCSPATVTTTTAGSVTTLTTPRLAVQVDTSTGQITFLDPEGQPILAEAAGGGRTLTAATVQGEATTSVRQQWAPNPDESLYGLGQHQHGLLDIKGTDLDLHQYNTKVFIPYLVSSRGYGILWDNTSYSRFGDLTAPVPLPGAAGLYASSGEAGDVNASAGSVNWSGTVTPTVTGDYTFRTYSSGTIQLSVNDQVVIDHYRQGWLPSEDIAHVTLTANQAVPVKLQWSSDIDVNVLRLLWKPPVSSPTTSLWSQVADGIDYTFVYGPELDDVVAGYRRLTGRATMLPLWAYGFWQCRERYKTAQE
ncbi:MAG: DUF4968 domain-containing protein, partial [Polyangiaceae bacterium]|nr:DUF4968 domain-containing protein [Polyangiaceae bacterium]